MDGSVTPDTLAAIVEKHRDKVTVHDMPWNKGLSYEDNISAYVRILEAELLRWLLNEEALDNIAKQTDGGCCVWYSLYGEDGIQNHWSKKASLVEALAAAVEGVEG